ncbi:hypothetical protein ANAPC5_01349 [Anaplasma phagocytophilum]|nr:hypothetical protein ANAPC5_01349 [Anaplasma phagocytophilum]
MGMNTTFISRVTIFTTLVERKSETRKNDIEFLVVLVPFFRVFYWQ